MTARNMIKITKENSCKTGAVHKWQSQPDANYYQSSKTSIFLNKKNSNLLHSLIIVSPNNLGKNSMRIKMSKSYICDNEHILIVDNDENLVNSIKLQLVESQFFVTSCRSIKSSLNLARSLDFDLLILDYQLLKEYLDHRMHFSFIRPVITLTNEINPRSRFEILEEGIEDYVCKPFDTREILFRVRKVLEFRHSLEKLKNNHVNFGPYRFYLAQRMLRRGSGSIRLTRREQEIMYTLASSQGESVSRLKLVGDQAMIGERTIDVQINKLRHKIEINPTKPFWLQTVRGIGYRLLLD